MQRDICTYTSNLSLVTAVMTFLSLPMMEILLILRSTVGDMNDRRYQWTCPVAPAGKTGIAFLSWIERRSDCHQRKGQVQQ